MGKLSYRLEGTVLVTTETFGFSTRSEYCDLATWETFEIDKMGARFLVTSLKFEDRGGYLDKVVQARDQLAKELMYGEVVWKSAKEQEAHHSKCDRRNKELEYFKEDLAHDAGVPSEEEKIDAVNRKAVELDCKYEIYGYRFVLGKPFHNTKKGRDNINRLFN